MNPTGHKELLTSGSSASDPTDQAATERRPPLWQPVAAVTGAVAALLLTPIQSLVWNGTDAPAAMRALHPLFDAARHVAERLGTDDMYHLYGRMFVVAYLGAIAGLATLPRHHLPRRGPLRTMTGALILATVLDVIAYSGAVTTDLPFLTEVAVVVVALIAGAVHGRHLLRARTHARWIGWTLIAAPPAVLPTLVLTQYLPHAVVLPLSLAVAVVSLRRPRNA